MRTFGIGLVLLLAAGAADAAFLPGDAAKGKTLHDQHCVACHDSGVYTRGNHRIQSVEALIGQVHNCVRQTGLQLDRDQLNDLVKYLDQSFYKFK
jgi:mono/diheme cytochrome c family protein